MNNYKNNSRNKLIVIGGALLCFACFAYLITKGNSTSIDDLRFDIYDFRNPVLNIIFIVITYIGNWQTITCIALVFFAYGKTRTSIGLPLAVTAISSTIIYKLVKMAFMRPRPDLMYRLITQGGYSFPSGHSMNGLVFFGMLIYLVRISNLEQNKKNAITVLLIILTAAIGFSRVYVGVHYPTDVFGGWSLGIAVLFSGIIMYEKIQTNRKKV